MASPEAVAAIITTDEDVSEYLPMTASQLLKIGVNDETILENQNLVINLKTALKKHVSSLTPLSAEELITDRSNKFNQVLNTWK